VVDIVLDPLVIFGMSSANNVYFEFNPNHCFVKCRASNEVLHGQVGLNGLYWFSSLLHASHTQQQPTSFPVPSLNTIASDNTFNCNAHTGIYG